MKKNGQEDNKMKPPKAKQSKIERKAKKEKKAKRKKLHRVLKNHPEFELTFDMQIGIRHVIGMEQGGVMGNTSHWSHTHPMLEDFEETISLEFPREGSNKQPFTPPHSSRDFDFKSYAPKIFHRIRDRFGINNIKFITSVCGNFEYLSFKTNSKSGQFFFYSHDKRYMLKTMTRKECSLLMKILPSYYQHVMENPNTLLCRFYGMHRVKPAGKMRSFHFLIMESVFDTSLEIHQIFDLKGSMVNRFAKRGESVFKDIDFVDNNFMFRLPDKVAKTLKSVVRKDSGFLKECNLMDYSLLVGVHYRNGKQRKIEYKQDRIRRMKDKEVKQAKAVPLGVPKKYNIISQPKKENVQMSQELAKEFQVFSKKFAGRLSGSAKVEESLHDIKAENKITASDSQLCCNTHAPYMPEHHGGLRSAEVSGAPGNEVYYVGIIDILTQYGFKKGMEHNLTSMFKDGNLISCVHPKIYGNRFEDFINKRIVSPHDIDNETRTETLMMTAKIEAQKNEEEKKSSEKAAQEHATEPTADAAEPAAEEQKEDNNKLSASDVLIEKETQTTHTPKVVKDASGDVVQTQNLMTGS
mmetsp:Transcript_29118/g.51172  ORF Transcript_29118/g.51172 Transcript_29118/m.51172 type:complete len:579 (+) Transcript_29118:184-1920(+)